MATDYVVHEANDTVGVVVIEGLKGGKEYSGWLMDGDKDLSMTILDDIPIGHKVALKDFKVGEDVITRNDDTVVCVIGMPPKMGMVK